MLDNSTCVFDGNYAINTTIYGCRSNMAACANDSVYIAFTMQSGSACATVDVQSAMSGVLKTYPNNTFASPATFYNYGDQVFFQITVDAGTGKFITLL